MKLRAFVEGSEFVVRCAVRGCLAHMARAVDGGGDEAAELSGQAERAGWTAPRGSTRCPEHSVERAKHTVPTRGSLARQKLNALVRRGDAWAAELAAEWIGGAA